MLKKYKKPLIATGLFTILLLLFPLVQLFFFKSTSFKDGKIALERSVKAPFLKNTTKDNVVLFFGYSGCVKVCTPILWQLNSLYESAELANTKDSVEVVFANLTPEIPADQPQIFAGGFNPDFHGIYLNKRELMEIEREFSLFYSRSISNDAEMTHSDYIYLLKRQKDGSLVLNNLYTAHPLNTKTIISDIKK